MGTHLVPRRLTGLSLALVAAVSLLLAAAAPVRAGVEVPFTPRFAASVHGDLTLAANTLMTCPASGEKEAECLGSRNGEGGIAALNNNGYAMERVDIDGDPGTFDSSSSTLTLPASARVLFAGLFYGARTSKGTGGAAAPDPAARATVLLRAPGALGYASLAATVNDSSSIAGSYTGFVDVTGIVSGAGAGTYSVADVQSGTGADRYAGWSLVVAYADPAAAPRSIRIFEGLGSIVGGEPPQQITVDGLETPPSGPVAAAVGIVAYEGDRGSSGDSLRLAGTPLSDPANPPNNVFNSSIANRGVDLGGRNPDYLNQLGFDANLYGADGILANGATSAVLEASTNLDQYLAQVAAFSVQLNPAALEPPPSPGPSAPPATAPPAPPHHQHKGGNDKGGDGEKGSGGPGPAPKLRVAAPAGAVPPTTVVDLSVKVTAPESEPLREVEVCNRLPAGLTRLRSPGARIDGHSACWRLARLAAGKGRWLEATARVGTVGRRPLVATTTAKAQGTRTRRVRTRLRVRALPLAPCGRVAVAGGPVAQASC
jgi:hypothetical protein